MEQDERSGELVILLGCLFLVPCLGWLVSTNVALGDEGELVAQFAYLAIGLGILLFVLILGSPLIAGTNRARMSLVFGPLVRLVMLLLAASVLIQGGLVVYSVFTLEAVAINRIHPGLLLAVGLGALFACLMLIRSAFGLFKVEPMAIRGRLLAGNEAPEMIADIHRLADQLGAEKPDHVVVGLEPNFFVTVAPISLVGSDGMLHGKTLFISLGLMRLLSQEEFEAVIGHELGHFRGEDVAYSMKFAPTYARLSHALAHLGESTGSGAADLSRIPATVALSLCLTKFATSERTVGRQRELLADQAGASVASPKALATALLKVGLFSSNWNWLTNEHIAILGEGRTYSRLSETYRDVCQLNGEVAWDDVLGQLGAVVQSHPIDTHPPLVERLESLGISLWDMQPDDCSPASDTAIKLIATAQEIDEDLSDLEAQWLLAIGAASLPTAALTEEQV